MPAKSNWVKGQTVTAADLNELAEAANNALSQEDADATYVRSVNGTPVDPVTGDVEVDGALPAGGSTGQVLTKLPDGPGWTTPATGGGSGGVLDGGTPTTTDDTFDGGTP
ncbi:hypothetical protein [Williamsia sp. DF01-3]|uniref:hypothetical protein n=1 Tax=Williamsia sp. DF01-3 TaxID=2934157 RepID=UPI001FF6B9B2|nr:hypothetical protein [Williamsia sp. DF01-3]MCK0517852.1 hypothetical protein [Williamsia sp. DF01-3]